ncbi:6-bladed beta-propeller [Bacteroides thetaiotaomicron]|jgi:hypothetical protein|uniref:6-bladed beta-propeller n=2 Tax=Bacteroides TaxID=816 RepID=UPI0011EEF6A6|nr:6-bladed beta-propeller [Bacteroides thetaiotaomicron]KAA0096983.1 6-bladed beta-propeller [Bacteroides thetaiotaomicron]KAA0100685.1 6-bladed beta-propeller [Bacteroides thetaiotaomicron]
MVVELQMAVELQMVVLLLLTNKMKSTVLLWSLVILLLGITGCVPSSTKIASGEVEVFNIDSPGAEDLLKLSDYCESATVVPLETSADCLLSEIKKVEVDGDLIYLKDNKGESVYCFDFQGHLKKKIGHRGDGPEDFVELTSFTLDKENGLVYVYSRANDKIVVYRVNGDFVESFPSPGYYAVEIEYVDNRLFLSGINSGVGLLYNLISLDSSHKVECTYMPSAEYGSSSPPVLRKAKGELYFYPRLYEDTIYVVKDDRLEMAFLADCGKHTMPDDFRERVNDERLTTPTIGIDMIKNGYILLSNLAVFDRFVFLRFDYRGQPRYGFYDRDQKTFVCTYDLNDDVSYLDLNSQHLWQTDDQVISTFDPNELDYYYNSLYSDPDYLKRMHLSQQQADEALKLIRGLLDKTSEDANPILIFYKVKK